jgi:general secretion pathway protein G
MIMTILATIVGINFAKEPGRARVAKATAQIGVFRNALQLYRMDNGQYPTMQQGLKAMCEKPQVHPLPTKYREGGYIESRRVPLDPWSNEYVYLVPGPEGGPFEIVSYGADGEPGGEGESSDVRSSDM